METLLYNFSGKVRRETLNGRKYLVAPMTLIVSGVLEGSKGPLYYPPDEVVRNAEQWNSIPIVVYHPFVDGKAVSARHPLILDRAEVGRVFNAVGKDGVLRGEGWFDEEATIRVDPRVHKSLIDEQPISISTGLYTRNMPVYNGPLSVTTPAGVKTYTFTAHDYVPDHLAVLPDEVGACTIIDGCGVLVNKQTGVIIPLTVSAITIPLTSPVPSSSEKNNVNREENITYLTMNCNCWKGKEDRETLNKLSDAKLNELRSASIETKAITVAAVQRQTVINAYRKAHNLPETTTPEQIVEALNKATPTDNQTPPAPTPTPMPVKTPMNFQEWLNSAPPEAQAVFNNAAEIERREKATIVEKLVVNVSDPAKKTAHAEYLMKRPLPDLRFELERMPAPAPVTSPFPFGYPSGGALYTGAAGMTTNTPLTPDTDDDILPLPTINWVEESKQGLMTRVS